MDFIAEISRWSLIINIVVYRPNLYLFYLLQHSASQVQVISLYNLKGFYYSHIAIDSIYIVNIAHFLRFNMQ